MRRISNQIGNWLNYRYKDWPTAPLLPPPTRGELIVSIPITGCIVFLLIKLYTWIGTTAYTLYQSFINLPVW